MVLRNRKSRSQPVKIGAIALAAALLLVASGCQKSDKEREVEGSNITDWVTLTIKHEVERKFAPIPWHRNMTVFDVLSKAQARDSVDLEYQGSADRLFVTAIDGFASDLRSQKSWFFSVNNVPADRSCGISRVQPGDSILWEYKEY